MPQHTDPPPRPLERLRPACVKRGIPPEIGERAILAGTLPVRVARLGVRGLVHVNPDDMDAVAIALRSGALAQGAIR